VDLISFGSCLKVVVVLMQDALSAGLGMESSVDLLVLHLLLWFGRLHAKGAFLRE
jgi:hypothetical protein